VANAWHNHHRFSGVPFTQTDLALAEDIGRRAALAVDNARLYREATDVGKTSVIILGEQQQQLRTPSE